jgi:hypothetical protein
VVPDIAFLFAGGEKRKPITKPEKVLSSQVGPVLLLVAASKIQ